MSDPNTSARLGMPLIDPGQAQKEMTHNEALTLLDIVVQASVVAVGMDVPPASPDPGAAWIVGDAPTGDWAGQARAMAAWTAGGWRFVAPSNGMAVWNLAENTVARFVDGRWERGIMRGSAVYIAGVRVVGERRAAIPDPAGGSVVDPEARDAVAAILATLRGHGLIAG